MSERPYPIYDADNHFYDPEDSITRYLPERWRGDFQFVTVNGRKRLAIGGKISNYIPNPSFERVAAPGSHLRYYRGENPEGLSLREIGGAAMDAIPSFRFRADRLKAMDDFGIHGALIFSNLFSIIESRMAYDHDFLFSAIHALNRFVDEEWGYARDGRIYTVPVLSFADADQALAELDWLLAQGARTVAISPAPVPGYRGSRSPGAREFDPIWARINESGIFVSIHASDTPYIQFAQMWVGGLEWTPFKPDAFTNCVKIIDRAISDTIAALICHGVFERFSNIRVAAIENGAAWVVPLIKTLHHVYGQMPQEFKIHPVEQFRRHIFVAPFNEDSYADLAQAIGASRVLFGSDWPHPEGLAKPMDILSDLNGIGASDRQKILSANLKGLLEGRRDEP